MGLSGGQVDGLDRLASLSVSTRRAAGVCDLALCSSGSMERPISPLHICLRVGQAGSSGSQSPE